MFEIFKDKKILIIGDLMVDEYIYGDVNRISPEAPVQILDYKYKTHKLGGAANVAMNIKSLNATPIICSVIGKKYKKIIQLLNENNIKNYIYKSDDRETTYKTRLICNTTQLLRIDYESKFILNDKENFNFLNNFDLAIKNNIDVVILSDYDKGVLNKNNIQYIISKCKDNNIPIIVDPKRNNFYEYYGATIFKPNLKELKNGLKKFKSLTDSQKYRKELGVENLMVTLSENGIHYCTLESIYNINGHKINIVDVSGAGDTVTALLSLLYSSNYDSDKIVKLCNIAGGLVCSKFGVSTITTEELEKEYKKISKKENNFC